MMRDFTDTELLKTAIDRIKLKQDSQVIGPNDLLFNENGMMVMEGKDWIWEAVKSELDEMFIEERNTKINTILNGGDTI
jgi:L-lactate utilization protein LutC